MLQGRLEFQRTQKAAAQMRATMGIMYEAIKIDYRRRNGCMRAPFHQCDMAPRYRLV